MDTNKMFWICGLLCLALSLTASSPTVNTTLPNKSTTGSNTVTVKINTSISDSSTNSGLVTADLSTQLSVSHTASSSDSDITRTNDVSSNESLQSSSSSYTSQTTPVSSSSSPSGRESIVKKEKKGISIWQGISIGLGSLCFIVMLAFIMTIVIICRLRGQLKRVRKTLYPASAETDHVYSELSNTANSSGKPKPSVKVELKQLKMTERHEELDVEEIHSPMSPDSQPVSSQFISETSEKGSSEPPPLKSRPPKRLASVPEMSKAKPVAIHHSYTNVGFDHTDSQELQKNGKTKIQIDYIDEDDTYEEYLNANLTRQGKASSNTISTTNIAVESQNPAMKMGDPGPQEVERQNSLSGLPDAVIQRVNSQLGADGMPLRDFTKGSIHVIDSGIPVCDFTSGLPSGNSLSLDDLDPYEDIDKYRNNEIVPTANPTLEVGRQNSLSELPDAVIQRVNSHLGADGMPLQDFIEEPVQVIDSGIPACDFTSGLPIETSLSLDDLDPYENIDKYGNNEIVPTAYPTQQLSYDECEGELYENTEIVDGLQSQKVETLKSNNPDASDRKNSSDQFDLFPLYDDRDVKMFKDNFDMDVELYDNHNAVLGSVTDIMTPDHTNRKDNRNDNGNDIHFANFDNMPFEMRQPGVQAKPNTLPIPWTSNVNGLPPFNSTVSAPENLNRRFVDSDPLVVFKNDPLRLRSDSASTPENYYLDLEDPNPVLNVEESKRISTQFPSDFYTRENFELSAPEQTISSITNDPFRLDNHVSHNDSYSNDQKISLEFENSVYSNINFTDPPDFFGTDSTT